MTNWAEQSEASSVASSSSEHSARDWRKSMSDHVAYALLVYTGLQIFVTVKALTTGSGSVLPLMALVVLVAAIIPACRWFEKRWSGLTDEQAIDPSFEGPFKRDLIGLWLMAIGLPFLVTGCIKAVLAIV